MNHVAARELEETLDISDIFAAAIALPRQTAAEAELAAEADGDDGADIGDFHENLAPALLASQKHHSGANSFANNSRRASPTPNSQIAPRPAPCIAPLIANFGPHECFNWAGLYFIKSTRCS